MISPLLASLLLAGSAAASEVATEKRLGVGVASGPFAISATGKYYLSDKSGISAYLGTSGVYHGLRANFESEFLEIQEWDFARLDLYWDAGIDFGVWTWFGSAAHFGIGGGVGIELQFNDVPASVFVDAGLGVYPVCSGAGAGYTGACLVGGRGAAGGRWYF